LALVIIGGGYETFGKGIQNTQDGGCIVLGSNLNDEFLLVKLNDLGDTMWSKKYSGDATDLKLTTEGGFVVVGTMVFAGTTSFIRKFDSFGNSIWYKEVIADNLTINSVINTSDSGFVVSGINNLNIFYGKFNSLGELLWSKTISNNSYNTALVNTNGGGFLILGTTQITPNLINIYLLNVDSLGIVQWSKTMQNSLNDFPNSIEKTADNGFIISSKIYYPQKSHLIKLDSNYNIEWSKVYGTTNLGGSNAVQTNDGGYITLSNMDWGFITLMKTNSIGDISWTSSLQSDINFSRPFIIRQALDSGYLICGAKGFVSSKETCY
jgi:hypothetical protein